MFQNVKKRLKDQRGLTLVELLAVIVILGIVAAIAVPSIGGIISKSKDDALKSDAIQVLNAAKLYASSTTLSTGNTVLSNFGTDNDDALNQFIDLKTGTEYSITITSSGSGYTYGAITVRRDGRQINNVDDDDLLNDNVTIGTYTTGG